MSWLIEGDYGTPMIDPWIPEGEGHTPLTEEDRMGLIPSYIGTRGDLFDAEERNIAHALLRQPPTVAELLDDLYLRDLHRAMFGQVWQWAGRYRLRQTNIGIEPPHIASAVRMLVGDVDAWVEHQTYEPDVTCVLFHHRLVSIHPFPNGNGRHSRLCADYLRIALGEAPFSWGMHLDMTTNELRQCYHAALRAADAGEISDLLIFALS